MLFEMLMGLVDYGVTKAIVKAPGAIMKNNFAELCKDTDGVIAGKTYQEIVAACGQPSAVSSLGDGTILRQWQETSYHIALLFDSNDICTGISSEISV